MQQIIVGVMMGFMVLGALDKALFAGRFGYGGEFEKGIHAMGELTLMMAGIMCVAPALGAVLAPVLSPAFSALGADPGMAGGMFFGVDMGGFPLVEKMTEDPAVLLLSGVLLGATLGGTISFIIPVGLGMCPEEIRGYAAKGIVAGIIASPVSAAVGGLVSGIPLAVILRNCFPAAALAAALAAGLSMAQKPTVGFFLAFSRFLSALGILWLAAGILEELMGIVLIPGMAPLGEQLVLIGEIGVTLAGAYPMVKFIKKLLSPLLARCAGVLGVNEPSACALLVCLANPLPMFDMVGQMTPRGITLAFAFATPATAVLGDHLGYVSAVCPEGVVPMMAGKLAAGVTALLIALALERKPK